MADRKEYMKKYQKNYYIKNRNRKIAYRIKNRVKIKKYMDKYILQYCIDNKERIKERNRQWSKDNPEYTKQWRKDNFEYLKQWYKNHSEERNEYAKQWRKNNIEKAREDDRQWGKNNPEKIKRKNKKYYIENKDKMQKYHRQWCAIKLKTDFRYGLNCRIRHSILLSLKGNKSGRKWETLLDYTLNDLIKRLKKTMPNSYTWQDYLKGKLHVDHIIPISAFNYTKSEHTDFKRCWALKNLQLLPARENLIKGAKLSKPFQPALRI